MAVLALCFEELQEMIDEADRDGDGEVNEAPKRRFGLRGEEGLV